jgi:hypothetical protein
MASRKPVLSLVMAIATVLALGHLLCLFPSPSAEAQQVVTTLSGKGVPLTPEQVDNLKGELYRTFVLNRIWDGILAVLAALLVVGVLLRRAPMALGAALLYAVVGVTYAAVASDFSKWGFDVIALQLQRTSFLTKSASLVDVAGHLFRLISVAWR